MCIKMLKSKVVLVSLASSLVFTNVNAMPVVDSGTHALVSSLMATNAGHFAQVIAQQAKEVAQWADEKTKWAQDLAHYAKEIQAYKDQLIATTGVKDLVSSFNELKGAYDKMEELYKWGEEIVNDPASFAKDLFKDTWRDYNKFDGCSKMSGEARASCYASFAKDVTTAGLNKKALENYKEVSKSSDKLGDKIKEAEDIKASTDVGNLIAKQQLDLAIHEARKQAMLQEVEAKAKLEKKQAIEASVEEMMKNRDDTKYFTSK